MKNEIILSICIPTDGTLRWVSQVLDGIYQQKCDTSKYEIVITDNGTSDDLESYIEANQFHNLTYKRSTSNGFRNIIDSLKLGKGLYCKVLNHRAVMLPGSLAKLISIIDKFKDSKPILFCSNGWLKLKDETICHDFNTFIRLMSYWSSWMGGIGIWKDDKVVMDSITYDRMFPNTSLLFEMCKQSEFVIENSHMWKEVESNGKGGYNVFRTFSVNYLDILNELRINERITAQTFISVKNDLSSYLNSLYYQEVLCITDHTFDLSDIGLSMQVYYSRHDYNQMKSIGYLRLLIHWIIIPFRKFFRFKYQKNIPKQK